MREVGGVDTGVMDDMDDMDDMDAGVGVVVWVVWVVWAGDLVRVGDLVWGGEVV